MEKRIRDHDMMNDDFPLRLPSKKRQRFTETTELSLPPPPPPPPRPLPSASYRINGMKEVNVKKFRTRGMNYKVNFERVNAGGIGELHPILQESFEGMIDRITSGIAGGDQVRMILHTPQLQYPIALPFMRWDQLSPERFLARVEQVLQSYEEFTLDEIVEVNLIHVAMPQGRGLGRRKTVNLENYLEKKRSIIHIKNNDELCLARSLIVAKAKTENEDHYSRVIDHRQKLQKELAEKLHTDAGVQFGACGLEEVNKFQEYLKDYQINIVSKELLNAIIYSGPESHICISMTTTMM